jgi:hypothetical protein
VFVGSELPRHRRYHYTGGICGRIEETIQDENIALASAR